MSTSSSVMGRFRTEFITQFILHCWTDKNAIVITTKMCYSIDIKGATAHKVVDLLG